MPSLLGWGTENAGLTAHDEMEKANDTPLNVFLPRVVKASNFYQTTLRRAAVGMVSAFASHEMENESDLEQPFPVVIEFVPSRKARS